MLKKSMLNKPMLKKSMLKKTMVKKSMIHNVGKSNVEKLDVQTKHDQESMFKNRCSKIADQSMSSNSMVGTRTGFDT